MQQSGTPTDPMSEKWAAAAWKIAPCKSGNLIRTVTRCGDFFTFFAAIGRYRYYTDGSALSVEFMTSTMRGKVGMVS